MRKSMKSGFEKFAPIHDMPIQKIRTSDMQDLIDSCPNKHATLELMILVAKNVFEYASKHDIVFKDYAKYLKINIADDDEKGVPFTDKELSVLWDNKDCAEIQIALILVYTGMRVSELKNIEINVEEHYFKGGVKTKTVKTELFLFTIVFMISLALLTQNRTMYRLLDQNLTLNLKNLEYENQIKALCTQRMIADILSLGLPTDMVLILWRNT